MKIKQSRRKSKFEIITMIMRKALRVIRMLEVSISFGVSCCVYTHIYESGSWKPMSGVSLIALFCSL